MITIEEIENKHLIVDSLTLFYYTLYEADDVILLYAVWSRWRHFTIHPLKQMTSFYYTLYEAHDLILLYAVWSRWRHFTIPCMKQMTSFYYTLYEADDVISNVILHLSNIKITVIVISCWNQKDYILNVFQYIQS